MYKSITISTFQLEIFAKNNTAAGNEITTTTKYLIKAAISVAWATLYYLTNLHISSQFWDSCTIFAGTQLPLHRRLLMQVCYSCAFNALSSVLSRLPGYACVLATVDNTNFRVAWHSLNSDSNFYFTACSFPYLPFHLFSLHLNRA